MKVFAILAFFAIAAVFAQVPVPITSGVTTTGSFLATDGDMAVRIYSLTTSHNVTDISVTFTDTTVAQACDFYVYTSAREVPCTSTFDVASEDLYPCRGNVYATDSFYTSGTTVNVYPSSYTVDYYFTLGGTVYFTVTRQSFSDDDACDFSVLATVTECPSGQVADFDTSSPACWPLTILDNGAASNATSYTMSPVLADDVDWTFYRVWVPYGASAVNFVGNVTIDESQGVYSPRVYFQNRYAPGDSYYYYYESASSNSIDDNWEFNSKVYYPTFGYAYVGFYYSAINNGSVTVSFDVCPAGVGGWNCSSPVYDATGVATVDADFTIVNPANSAGLPFDDSTHYVVLNTVAPQITSYVNYTFTLTSGLARIIYKKDGWVDNDLAVYLESANYDTMSTAGDFVNIALTPADLAFPGSFVIAVQNNGVDASTAVVAVASSASSGSTTGDSTAAVTTGATTGSGASSVAYCVALIVLCIAALF